MLEAVSFVLFFRVWRWWSRCHGGAVFARSRNVSSASLTSVFNSARSRIQHAAFAGHVVVQRMSDGVVPLASWAVPHHRRDVACAALACYARVFGVCLHAVALAAWAVGVLISVGNVRVGIVWE